MKPVLSAIALATIVLAAACTMRAGSPSELDPGRDAALARTFSARGVQVYECRAVRASPLAFEWVFIAPEAELYDERGRLVGHHGAGPAWETVDGSRIEGRVRATVAAPVDNAIPWLLLDATDTGRAGLLRGVTRVQRVNTWGGTKPRDPCELANTGRKSRVPYVAEYRFFTTPAPQIR